MNITKPLCILHISALQDKKCNDDLSSSSSNMISFELSNGHPYGPHVPTTWEDDQYVEYGLDDLAGFPSSAEEEERVSKFIGFSCNPSL